jgi:toxin ParE1/3/4
MRYEVLLTEGAERDLEEIHDYIAEFDSPKSAERVLDRLLAVAESLADSPERGSPPKELRPLGIEDFRQVFFKPYRVIYRIIDRQLFIYVIADGRRDMQSLLAHRLLNA